MKSLKVNIQSKEKIGTVIPNQDQRDLILGKIAKDFLYTTNQCCFTTCTRCCVVQQVRDKEEFSDVTILSSRSSV